jgi:hypothetical protein
MMGSEQAENRKYYAGILFLLILIALIAFLVFIPIPAANREIILTILAVLLGAAATNLPNLSGNENAEKEALQKRVQELEFTVDVLNTKYSSIKDEYDSIVKMLVERIELGTKEVVVDTKYEQ